MTALNIKDTDEDSAVQIFGEETTGGIAWFRRWMLDVVLQAPLLNGTAGQHVALVLTPGRLQFVCKRLEHFEEMERLKERSPVEYFRAYASDLGDSRQIQELYSILVKLQMLRVCVSKRVLDKTAISVGVFRSLTSLELHGCEISANSPVGLQTLRGTLQRLVCVGSIPSLKSILAGSDRSVEEADEWPCLRHLACVKSGLQFMDSSVALLPAVSLLNLSRARISSPENLQECAALTCLDLSFNLITSTAGIHRVVGCVTCLILRCNNIRCAAGLEHIPTLRSLDLAGNLLSNMQEVARLTTLPCLNALWLEGNPLSFQSNNYRAVVLSLFPNPSNVRLDGQYATNRTVASACRIARTNFSKLKTAELKIQVQGEAGSLDADVVRFASILPGSDCGTLDMGASNNVPQLVHREGVPAVQSSAQHEVVQAGQLVAYTPQKPNDEQDSSGQAPSVLEASAALSTPERGMCPTSEAPLLDELNHTAFTDDLHGVARELSQSPRQPTSAEAQQQSSHIIDEHQFEGHENGSENVATSCSMGPKSARIGDEGPVTLNTAGSEYDGEGLCSPQSSSNHSQDASTGGDKQSSLATTPSWTWWGLTALKRRVLDLVPKKDLPRFAPSVFDSVPVQNLAQSLGSEDDKTSCTSDDNDASVSSASHYTEDDDVDAASYDKRNRSLSFLEIAAAPSLGILGIPGILPPSSSRAKLAGKPTHAAALVRDTKPDTMGWGETDNDNGNDKNGRNSSRDDFSGVQSCSKAPHFQSGCALLPAGADATASELHHSDISQEHKVSSTEAGEANALRRTREDGCSVGNTQPASTGRYQAWIQDMLTRCPAPRLSYRSFLARHFENEDWVQRMFRLRVKARGSAETGLACFRCDCVWVERLEDSSKWEMVDALVLFSEVRMYVCRLDTFFVLQASSLSNLPTFWVGWDHQIVFLGDQQVEVHLVLRDGKLVQDLVAHLLDACTSCCPGKHVCVASLEHFQYESIQARCCDKGRGRHDSRHSGQTLLMCVMVQWLRHDEDIEANNSGTSLGNSDCGRIHAHHCTSGVSTSSCEVDASTASSKWSSRTCMLVLTRTQILLLDVFLPTMLIMDEHKKSDNTCCSILGQAHVSRLVHIQYPQKSVFKSVETLSAPSSDLVMMTGETTHACQDRSAKAGICNWAPSVRLTLVFEDSVESGQHAEHGSRDHSMLETGRDALPHGLRRWEVEISEAEAVKLCTLLKAL